jgi:hypothetical protein
MHSGDRGGRKTDRRFRRRPQTRAASESHLRRRGPRVPRGGIRTYAALRASASFVNDPSAGSPTETLLRLLLPLDDQV